MSDNAPPARSTPMAKFIGYKTHEQIKQQCASLGLELHDTLYKEGNSDFIIIEGGGARVYYSGFNGMFFGTTDQGIKFDSNNADHEDQPWFQTLLDFFYIGRIEVKPS